MNNNYNKNQDNSFDDLEFDFDFTTTDLKINPEYYIHTAILRAQKCLLKDDIKSGFLAYKVFIEHIETLCRSAKIINKDYDEEIKKFIEDIEKENNQENTKDNIIKHVRISNKKLELMMSAVFDNKTITSPIKAA